MKKWTLFLGLLTVLLFSAAVFAGEEKREKEEAQAPVAALPEVVVTGTRFEQEVKKIPANITVITAEDIKNSNARSVVDLFRTQEGIFVRDKLSNGKTAEVDLRGFGETAGSNTLVLVDGRRVNSIDLSGTDWAQIPLDQIERIEILRGTGTVLYGDNAAGGVINIITKKPAGGFKATADLSLGSYAYDRQAAAVNSGYQITPDTSVFFSASREDTDGYRSKNHYNAKNAGGKIIFEPTEYLSLSLNGQYHDDNFDLPGGLTKDELNKNPRDNVNRGDRADTTDKYLKSRIDLDLAEYGNLVADAAFRNRKSDAFFPDPSFPFQNELDTDTWSLTPRWIYDGNVFGRSNRLIAGVDLYWNDQDTRSFAGFFSPIPSSPTGKSDVGKDSYGIYFNDEFYLFDHLLVSLGARHEKAKYDLDVKDLTAFPLAPLNKSFSDSKDAYSAGLTFLYGKNSSAFVRVNRSFRFPLTDELVVFDFVNGVIRVNPDLKPQTGMHYEIGVRHFLTPGIRVDATLFRSKMDDEIFFNRPTFTNKNHPGTLRNGIEVGVNAKFLQKFSVYGNYTYEKATFEVQPYKNKDVPSVPAHRFNAGLRIFNILPGLDFSADGHYVGSSWAISDFDNNFEKLGSYYTINMRLSYGWKNLRAFVGVNNLTDQEYSEFAVIGGAPLETSFYPAPEINFIAGLTLSM